MPTYTEADLERKIREGLGESCVHVKATDESDGCGSKFEVLIVSRYCITIKAINMLITITNNIMLL